MAASSKQSMKNKSSTKSLEASGQSTSGGSSALLEDDEGPVNYTQAVVEHTYKYIYKEGIFSTRYNHDGSIIALGFGDNGIELLDSSSGKRIKELCPHKYGSQLGAMTLCFNPSKSNRLLVGTSDGVVFQYDVEKGDSKKIIVEERNEINCLDFAYDGSRFATAGKDMDIRVYDPRSNRMSLLIAGYNTENTVEDTGGHAQRVFALRFFPHNADLFVTGGWDNNLKVWDCRAPTSVVRVVSGPHIAGEGLDIKGERILTGSWRAKDALQMWDLGSGKLITTFPLDIKNDEDREFLYCARFYGDSALLGGGSGTQSLQAIDINSKKLIGELCMGSTVHTVDVHRRKQFACGGQGLKFHIARLS